MSSLIVRLAGIWSRLQRSISEPSLWSPSRAGEQVPPRPQPSTHPKNCLYFYDEMHQTALYQTF
jgi:hypothetical protein